MTTPAKTSGRLFRVLQFPVIRIILEFSWLILVVGLVQSLVAWLPGSETLPLAMLSLFLVLVATFQTYIALIRTLEKRSVVELAWSGALPELAAGILVGVVLFTLTIGILWVLGVFTITGLNAWNTIIPVFAGSMVSGVFEEMLFRGILFRIVEESLGSWLALLISALLFGLLHLINPNANLAAALAIALEAGVLLAAAYMFTRRLWLAMGIHFAWNFTQGGIFGVAVSGNEFGGLFKSVLTGPPLLSGGEFGAEASIIAVLVCGAAGAWLLWRAYRSGQFIKPSRKRQNHSAAANEKI